MLLLKTVQQFFLLEFLLLIVTPCTAEIDVAPAPYLIMSSLCPIANKTVLSAGITISFTVSDNAKIVRPASAKLIV